MKKFFQLWMFAQLASLAFGQYVACSKRHRLNSSSWSCRERLARAHQLSDDSISIYESKWSTAQPYLEYLKTKRLLGVTIIRGKTAFRWKKARFLKKSLGKDLDNFIDNFTKVMKAEDMLFECGKVGLPIFQEHRSFCDLEDSLGDLRILLDVPGESSWSDGVGGSRPLNIGSPECDKFSLTKVREDGYLLVRSLKVDFLPSLENFLLLYDCCKELCCNS